MTTTGLSHINFHAPRELLDALKDFYCDIVGLQMGARPPFPMFGYWLYAGGLPVVHLYEATRDDVRALGAVNTFDHIAFDCDDQAGVERVLQSRALKYRVALVPASNQVQIFLRDPAGNKVELNFGDSGAK
ncbi:MAG: VOC family protein [Betaproteobacteria bacterium]|nr:VOC family protein [Betaproteobacteria bacterium]